MEAAQHPSQQIQASQAAHRQRIVDSWGIPTGANILEIGCGQGDMTMALAKAVGPNGRILAVDSADPSYGAPFTLGQATDQIKTSSLGGRADFRFNFDLLADSVDFADDQFDTVAMAHSSWYFPSLEQLTATFRTIRPWAKSLCFAEWDLAPQRLEQLPHYLAVVIHGQVEAFKTNSEANIRTPFPRSVLKGLLQDTGWSIVQEEAIDASDLADADWEIAACLKDSPAEAKSMNLPEKFVRLLETQIESLRQIAKPGGNPSLPCYTIVAERSG